MRTPLVMIVGLTLLISAAPARADDTPATSRIVAVGLFKNGLAIVKREATLGRAGTYVLDDVPQPIHGTYWVESAVPIETAVKMREIEVPANETPPGDLQEDLAGKKVTIHFKGGQVPPATGTVVKFKPSRSEEGRPSSMPYVYPPGYPGESSTSSGRYLVLQNAKGRSYLQPSEIAYIESEGPEEKVKRRQPRLLLTVGETDKAETRVAISYLTRGLSWAPSYRIDITDPKTLTLEQQAVIKNELTNLDNAEVKLISGFPSVQFAHVTSPMSSRTTWAAFFHELGRRGWRDADLASNSITGQGGPAGQSLDNGYSPLALGMSAIPTGEGVDLHYQSVGKRTLAEGDSLTLNVAKNKTSYERIVEWLIPDTRDESGRNIGQPGYAPQAVTGRGGEADDSPWDALKFKNPFSFPMTTGPALVVADGNFNGQRTAFWVNAGEETVLRINKALSVRTRSVEHEELPNGGQPGAAGAPPGAFPPGPGFAAGAPRDLVWIGGQAFRKSTVEGELSVSNHRKESIQLVIRRRFSGDLVKADGSPKTTLREEGAYSVNHRNELVWTIPLKAGEVKKLTYRYTVLVSNGLGY